MSVLEHVKVAPVARLRDGPFLVTPLQGTSTSWMRRRGGRPGVIHRWTIRIGVVNQARLRGEWATGNIEVDVSCLAYPHCDAVFP